MPWVLSATILKKTNYFRKQMKSILAMRSKLRSTISDTGSRNFKHYSNMKGNFKTTIEARRDRERRRRRRKEKRKRRKGEKK